jgi:hypothetical protein
MKRLVSFLLGAVVVIGVLVLFIVFAHHNGPGDSPRDSDNAKTVPAAAVLAGGGASTFARL